MSGHKNWFIGSWGYLEEKAGLFQMYMKLVNTETHSSWNNCQDDQPYLWEGVCVVEKTLTEYMKHLKGQWRWGAMEKASRLLAVQEVLKMSKTDFLQRLEGGFFSI